MLPKGWSDLPPDLLRDIAGCLHVATDFVTFHAVCNPWRSSLSGTRPPIQLLPWFHALTEKHGQSSPFKFMCIFSKSTYHVLPRLNPRRRNWVYNAADGATVGYLTVKQLRPTLHDLVTGAVTDLPRFPFYFHYHWEENPWGVIYGDGTVFLYISRDDDDGRSARFYGAVLRPVDTKWTLVHTTFDTSGRQAELCAVYHSGRFLFSVESSLWCIVLPDDNGDVLVQMPCMEPEDPDIEWERFSYTLESRGEQLWVLVQVQLDDSYRFASCIKRFLVSVYGLEEAMDPEEVRWVEKEGHGLSDRVLFLGSPNSFAIEASLLGGKGGCAYFVYHNSEIKRPGKSGMFRYNFLDGKTERIQRLPEEWDDEKCTWLVPQLTIDPIQKIIRRKLQSLKLKKHQKAAPITSLSCIFHIERHYEHRFRVLVQNLPLEAENYQLYQFFSGNGKVSSTKIIYHKKTKTSKGIVKMVTMHAHEEDALAVLRGLDFYGCSVEVVLVDDRQRQRRLKAT